MKTDFQNFFTDRFPIKFTMQLLRSFPLHLNSELCCYRAWAAS